MNAPLLEVKNLKKTFIQPSAGRGQKARIARAVDGVSFHIDKGETFGLVGESGCGKTVTGKMILKLIQPTEGEIFYRGLEITGLSQKKFRTYRKDIQTVFQDFNAALDPKMTIENIIAEPILLHGMADRSQVKEEVYRLLNMVGLGETVSRAFPYELSSGQKQRVAIAKAISTKPGFILCDEPVSALDVSVQSQVLNILTELKKQLKMTYLFISHNLNVVYHVSDRVGVMYLGRIIETGTTDEIFHSRVHPYTKALLAASPTIDPDAAAEKTLLKGEVPLCTDIPSGCRFHPRCPEARELCRTCIPVMKRLSPTHTAACHLL